MVRDIDNLPSAAADSNPMGLTVFNGALYFQANDGVNGIELWKTDGTAEGTRLLKDICIGPCNGNGEDYWLD